MAETNMIKARLRLARKPEADWIAEDPVALEGEWMVTAENTLKVKVGDGLSKWSELSYLNTSSIGIAFGNCETDAKTLTKTVSIVDYRLFEGVMVSIKFADYVPMGSTLNIGSTGDVPIYYNGSPIIDNIIVEGNIATFIYDGLAYHVIAVDKLTKLTDTIEDNTDSVPSGAAITTEIKNLNSQIQTIQNDLGSMWEVVTTWGEDTSSGDTTDTTTGDTTGTDTTTDDTEGTVT